MRTNKAKSYFIYISNTVVKLIKAIYHFSDSQWRVQYYTSMITKGLFLREIARRKLFRSYHIIIGKNSSIGKVILPHPMNITIGEGVVVGSNVTIYQGVTLGARHNKDGSLEYPTIEDGCVVFPGAIVIGKIVIGQGSVIGANAFVNISAPPYSTLVGVPARILNKNIDNT